VWETQLEVTNKSSQNQQNDSSVLQYKSRKISSGYEMTTMKATGGASPSRKITVLSHVKYEHLVAGISGGVASTLILHPLDLIKIRFAGNVINSFSLSFAVKTQEEDM
jgi:hypothetical protein